MTDRDSLLMRELAAVRRAEASVRPVVRAEFERFLRDVQDAVLYGDAPIVSATKDRVLAISAAAAQFTRRAWQNSVSRILEAVGKVFSARFAKFAPDREPDARLASYLDKLGAKLDAIADEVYDRVVEVLNEATSAGLSTEATAERLSEALDIGVWESKVEMVTVTETVGAYNAGAQSATEANIALDGRPRYKEWLSLQDGRVRPTHVEADGQKVLATATFTVGGFHCDVPGDPALPPQEACNCRCVAHYGTAEELGIVAGAGRMDPMTDTVQALIAALQVENPKIAALIAAIDAEYAETGRLPDGWRGVMAPLNRPTGDDRQLNMPPGGFRSRMMPLTFRFQPAAIGGHDGAVMAGRIDYAWVEDGFVMGEGALDLGGEWGAEYARQLAEGFAMTLSVDPDEVTFEQQFFNADGEQVPFNEAVIQGDGDPRLEEGYVVRDVMVDWRLSGVTAVQIPAFDEARIEPVYDYVPRPAPADQPDYSDSSMLALTPANADRFAVEGGTPAADLHVTLAYLGKDADLSDQTHELASSAASYASKTNDAEPATVAGYGVLGDKGANVLFLNGKSIANARTAIGGYVASMKDCAEQHEPFLAHMTIGYGLPADTGAQFVGQDVDFYSVAHHRGATATHYPIEGPKAIAASLPEAVVAAPAGGQIFALDNFANPNLTGPTPLTVTDDGRVFGHVATWGACYMAFGGEANKPCVSVPFSNTDYSRFKVHGAKMDDGSIMAVGAITFGDGHRTAGGLRASQRLYADVASVAAKVACGEDQFGIWVSGEVVDEFRDRAFDLLLSPLSGHWEPDGDVGGQLEMLAAHVVVAPGFKVPRLIASVDDDGNYTAISFAGVERRAETPTGDQDAIVAAVQADRKAQRALRKLGLDAETRAKAALARLGH